MRAISIEEPSGAPLTLAGMTPPGKKEINPAVNAIHSLVAVKQDHAWQIALFQNTPAQFHGRPELAQALTEELQRLAGYSGNLTQRG